MLYLRKSIFIFLGVCFIAFNSKAQAPWLKPFENTSNLNFFDIQKNFYSTYHKKYSRFLKDLKHKGKEEEEGEDEGIIQFKRWENFWQPRVNRDGSFPPTNALYTEWKKYYAQLNTSDRSVGYTANWTSLGPSVIPGSTGSGRVNVVRFDPNNSNKIFVGTPDGGLWVSTNSGNTWATTTDMLPSIGVTDVAVDPTNSNTIYIATGDGDANDSYSFGVMKSTDNGATWDTTGLTWTTSDQITISRLLIKPDSSNSLLAATSRGIYTSHDGGYSWSKKLIVRQKDMAFKPFHPSTIYASGAEFYKSIDGGNTWAPAGLGLPNNGVSRIAVAVSNADSNSVFAIVADNTDYGLVGVYKSTNSGVTFSLLYNTLNLLGWSSNGGDVGGQGWYDLSIAVSQFTTDTIYTGGVDVWRSINGGKTFSIYGFWAGPFGGPYVHADDHFLTYSPDEKYIYVGCDGGIYSRDVYAANWTDLSSGLDIMEIYRFSNSTSDANLITTGAQDNGTCASTGVNDWNLILGGDGMQTLIDYNNQDIIYGENPNGDISKSTDGGNTFNDISPNASGAWVTPYVIDPNNDNILYIGENDIYKSTDQGNNWTNVTNGLTNGGTYNALAVAPSNSNVIYAAVNSDLFVSTDAGATWQSITSGLPGLSITYIAVKNTDANTLWVTFSGFNPGYEVYKSTNAGATWTNISKGLPGVPTNCVVYQNNSNDELYVGTDLGVFYINASMTSWVPYNNGLPNVEIDELGIQYTASVLRAATYGRGMWQTNLITETPQNTLAKNSSGAAVLLYPNPASQQTELIFNNAYSNPVEITLYNVLGQIMIKETLPSITQDEIIPINLSLLAKGVYLVNVISNDQIITTQKLAVFN